MNITELSKKLNLSEETIRRWEIHFNLDINKDSEGRKLYSEFDLKMFYAIKLLRDSENVPDKIPETIEPQINKFNELHVLNYLINEINILLENRLTYILEVSEKYSKVNYELGNLKAELETKKDVLSLIAETYNKVINSFKKEIEKKNKEIEEINSTKDREIELLKAELEKVRSKSWWRKLM